MKKAISLLLSVLMCLSLGAILASCDNHEHSYYSQWEHDETHHWHTCAGENCTEVSDKAEHTWDEGIVTSDPDYAAKKTKTLTCTVCHATQREFYEFEGITESEWNAGIAEQKFSNVTIGYTFNNTAEKIVQMHTVKITEDALYHEVSVYANGAPNGPARKEYFTGEAAAAQKKMYIDIFLRLLAEKENFVYDKETGLYISPEAITTTVSMGEGMNAVEVMTGGKVLFTDDGILESFTCTLQEIVYNNNEVVKDVTGSISWGFTNYGKTTISAQEKQ